MTATTVPTGPPTPKRRSADRLAGTATLARFALRRERLRIGAWLLLAAGLVLGNASSYQGLFVTAAALDERVELVLANPAVLAATGPGYGFADATVDNLGPLVANDSSSVFVLVAVMSVLMIIRHTRAEEETGRTDLVRGAAVGSHAHLSSALLITAIANVVLAGIVIFGLIGMGFAVAGSAAFGIGIAGVGLAFAAIAGAVGQLTEHARVASGVTLAGMLGGAFLLRGIGDITGGGLSWLSPIGWAQAVRPYADERWWPLLLLAALVVAGVATAFVGNSRRDVGAGVVAARPGRPKATDRLRSSFTLAIRTHRGSLVAWALGLFVLGIFGGGMLGALDAGETVQTDVYQRLFDAGNAAEFADHTFVFWFRLIALLVCVYALLSVSRAREEEASGRIDALLASSVSRRRWLGAQVAVSVLGTAVLLLMSGLCASLVYAAVADQPMQVSRLTTASIVHLPAIMIFIGCAFTVFGFVPRLLALLWAAVAWAFFVSLFGRALPLPDWVIWTSIAEWTPNYPERPIDAGIVLIIIIVLLPLGLADAAFRRRDVQADH